MIKLWSTSCFLLASLVQYFSSAAACACATVVVAAACERWKWLWWSTLVTRHSPATRPAIITQQITRCLVIRSLATSSHCFLVLLLLLWWTWLHRCTPCHRRRRRTRRLRTLASSTMAVARLHQHRHQVYTRHQPIAFDRACTRVWQCCRLQIGRAGSIGHRLCTFGHTNSSTGLLCCFCDRAVIFYFSQRSFARARIIAFVMCGVVYVCRKICVAQMVFMEKRHAHRVAHTHRGGLAKAW